MVRMGSVAVLGAAAVIASWTGAAPGPSVTTSWAAAPILVRAEFGAPPPQEIVGAQARVTPDERPPRHVLASQIDRLIDRVVALNERYGWSWNDTGALIASLEEAFIDLDDGRMDDAADQLRTFRDRISVGLADGSLTPEAGGPLLAATADLLTRVEALAPAAGPPALPDERD